MENNWIRKFQIPFSNNDNRNITYKEVLDERKNYYFDLFHLII